MKIFTTLSLLFFSSFLFAQQFDIYVSDAGNFNNPPWQILKFDENGQNPSVFINTNLAWPQDILFLEDSNHVLISNLNSGIITKHDASTGTFITNFATSISGPTRIKIGPDSLLYVLQWSGNGKVLRYELDGTYLGEFTSRGVPQSIGIDWDRHGNLYVSSYNGDFVRKFDPMGNDMGLFVSSNLLGPTNIWFNSKGDLLVADYDGTTVRRFDSTGTYLGNFIQGLRNCEGVAFFPNGDILIGNGGTRSVKLYDSTGAYKRDLISTGSGSLRTPNAVVIREKTTTSIQRPMVSARDIIHPLKGTRFYLNPRYKEQITSLNVYNLSGQLVESGKKSSNPFWQAADYPEGVYIITVLFQDGRHTSGKLMVTK